MKKSILLILVALMLLPMNVYAFQLDVTHGEDTYTIETESSDTIEDVKVKVETATSIEVDKQVLRKDTTLLEEGRTLADYSITTENPTPITLTLKKVIGKIEYTLTEPTEGATPDTTADIIMTTTDGKETFEFKDVKIEWAKIIDYCEETIDDLENYKFEDKMAYRMDIEYRTAKKLYQEYDIYNAFPDEYINGVIEKPEAHVVINGIKTIDIIMPTLYENQEIPKKLTFKLTDPKGTRTEEIEVEGWYKYDEENKKKEEVAEGELAKKGYIYSPVIPIPDEIHKLTDRHTVYLKNGKTDEEFRFEGIKPLSTTTGGTGKNESIEVPETGDDIDVEYIISLTSLISLIGLSIINKKVLN